MKNNLRALVVLVLLWSGQHALFAQGYLYTFQGLPAGSPLDGSYVILSNAVPGAPTVQDLLAVRILDNFGPAGSFDVSVSSNDFAFTGFDARGFTGTISGDVQSYVGPTRVQLVGMDSRPSIFANNNGFYPGNPSGEGAYGQWQVTPLWSPTTAPSNYWYSLASSANGTVLAAVIGGAGGGFGPIFTSTNSGESWTPAAGANSSYLAAVAASADGAKLVAATFDPVHRSGAMYSSTNSGASWDGLAAPGSVVGLASSADGAKLAAAAWDGIYLSTDSGETWQLSSAPATNWLRVAMSTDGTKLVAAASTVDVPAPDSGGPIYASGDSGLTWVPSSAPVQIWRSVAVSANGTTAVAGAVDGPIYVSLDSGATWTPQTGPGTNWNGVAISADGTRLAAAGVRGVFTCTAPGFFWISNSLPSLQWTAAACSADGNKLVAATRGAGIYLAQTLPTPQIHATPFGAGLSISWLVPSTDFTLQENGDLATSNWTDVLIKPVLNLTNLQNEVSVLPSIGNHFYRLKH